MEESQLPPRRVRPSMYFVKYGDPDTLWPEAATQRYIFEYAKSQPDTQLKPRIADVVHYFEGAPRSFLVMEHFTLASPPSSGSQRLGPYRHLIGFVV